MLFLMKLPRDLQNVCLFWIIPGDVIGCWREMNKNRWNSFRILENFTWLFKKLLTSLTQKGVGGVFEVDFY